MFANVVVITLATHFFDDYAEQKKAIVAVFPLTARIKPGGAVAVKFYIVLQRA